MRSRNIQPGFWLGMIVPLGIGTPPWWKFEMPRTNFQEPNSICESRPGIRLILVLRVG